MKTKRLLIATIFGVVFGFVCFGFAASGNAEMSVTLAIQIIVSRTLIGFAIGISRFGFGHWSIHGLLMGLIFSIPGAFGVLMMPENQEFCNLWMFFATIIMGMIYGFLIELITTVFFKLKQ